MIKTLKKYLLSVLIFSFSGLYAQDIKVSASIDSANIIIGDQVKLKLNVEISDKTKLFWPALSDSISEHIEIVSKSKIDTLKNSKKGWQTYNQTLTITSFDSGSFYFPQIPFLYKKTSDTASYTLLSDSVLLNVNTVKVDTTKEIKDIKGIMSAPLTFAEVLPYILGGLGLLLIIGFVIYYFKKRKKGEAVFQKPKPIIPAHILALQALEVLNNKKLWQNNKVKDYYTELTDILRTYLEKRFGINALEMTSDEIIESTLSLEIETEIRSQLRKMLQTADLVKFAKGNPLQNEHTQAFEITKDFVEKTKPIAIETKEININSNELNSNSNHETV